MSLTLLLPCAGPSPTEAGQLPNWLQTTPYNELMLCRAAASVPAGLIGRVVVAVLAEDDRRLGAGDAVRRGFAGSGIAAPVDLVVLPERTGGPAETVRRAIDMAGITGRLAIKDSDNFFAPVADLPEFCVAVADVRENPDMARIGNKSFVRVNEQGFIVDIVEKQVCSNLVSVGLYGFPDATVFSAAFDALYTQMGLRGVYVSHVLQNAIGQGALLLPVPVAVVTELESETRWREHRKRHGTLIVDLDGVVFRHAGGFLPPIWDQPPEPIAGNVAHLRDLQNRGAQLIFITARPERLRTQIMAGLQNCGLRPHALVMDARSGHRCLISDTDLSKPYPAATAVNVARDAEELRQKLP